MINRIKIGILGGSFDPVHKAHIELAKAVYEQCELDLLLFVPARQAALKDNEVCATAQDRLNMLEIATKNLSINYQIDTFELDKDEVSYSIDTAKYLYNKYPNAKLVWIIGSDHIGKLDKWKDVDQLCNIVEFACAKRDGYPLQADTIPLSAKIEYVKFEPILVSSTEIRKHLKNGKNLETMLESKVISYIKDKKLNK